MRILIIGAAGMVGSKLAASLAGDAESGVEAMTLVDMMEPTAPATAKMPVGTGTLDITDAAAVAEVIAARPDVIFHLAAIVSGEAEADFDKGYAVNFDGTRNIFDAIRSHANYHPRVVFTSSIAVYGAPFPDPIPDEYFLTPLTSYGTQKLMGEAMLADYSRREIFDGVGLRLPTICVRPGKPNKAASGFFSNILREPLVGKEAILPVSDEVRHWHASPRAAVGFLRHAMTMDTACDGRAAERDAARAVGDGGRADRGAAARGRRRCGEADPPRGGSGDREDGRGLADAVRGEAGAGSGVRGGKLVRRDHRGACRGRVGRQDRRGVSRLRGDTKRLRNIIGCVTLGEMRAERRAQSWRTAWD